MTVAAVIRPVEHRDAEAIARIYGPYVTETAISFEYEPPSAVEFSKRIKSLSAKYPYLVAEVEGAVVAYAYAGEYRTRSAYRFSVEVSAYAAPRAHGLGLGKALYEPMLKQLTDEGYHTALAVVTLPNAQSVRFHERLGFEHVGTTKEVGYKFGTWHDTGTWQRHLSRDLPTT